MLTRTEYDQARLRAFAAIAATGFPVGPGDRDHTVAADFGLSDLRNEGAQILTFFNTDRISGKLIELLPGQTLPEHWHPPVPTDKGTDPGKEETLRVVSGTLYYVDAEPAGGLPPSGGLQFARIPKAKDYAYSCRQEHVMKRGDQITIEPGRKHWLQGGPEGCVVFSFSTCVRDVLDQFTDPAIERTTKIID
jgi:D-lyxose ketol-isomerase